MPKQNNNDLSLALSITGKFENALAELIAKMQICKSDSEWFDIVHHLGRELDMYRAYLQSIDYKLGRD